MSAENPTVCPTCAGEGSFESWSNPGCAPGDERFRSEACPCCGGDGVLPEGDAGDHDGGGECCRREPDEDQLPGGKENPWPDDGWEAKDR